MIHQPLLSQPLAASSQRRSQRWKRLLVAIATGTTLALNLFTPALADPFRSANPHTIDDQTEAAFRVLFEQGNYREAEALLQTADPNEPLSHAMKASLAYLDGNPNELQNAAAATLSSAQRLMSTDPLRGHLYTAVGHFLEGAHTAASANNIVTVAPAILSKLQEVFASLREAERIDATDPELNLLKGYMDLMLSVNLPFADANQAIQRLQQYAAPSYLAQRGIAIAYRDLDEEEAALEAVERAIAETPDNPELAYLKAQILVGQGNYQASIQFFEQALAKRDLFPSSLATQLAYEHCRALYYGNERRRNQCRTSI